MNGWFMGAELVIFMSVFWLGLMSAALLAMAVVRYIRSRRCQEFAVEDDYISDSVAPILRWNLRGGPCALNRRRSAESLETMEFGESHYELLDALRTRDQLASRLAVRILGRIETQGVPHAWMK